MKNAKNKTRLVNLYIAQSSVTIALQVQKRERQRKVWKITVNISPT